MQQQQESEKAARAAKKAEEEMRKAELAELFKPVQTQQKVPFGIDPKTILCQFFKAGQCQKGDKCKFSHDINVERKEAKIDLYTDKRAEGELIVEFWICTVFAFDDVKSDGRVTSNVRHL